MRGSFLAKKTVRGGSRARSRQLEPLQDYVNA
jgi:hypothetical protein